MIKRAVAQFGSALDWGSRGRGFKSRQPDSNQDRIFGPDFCLMGFASYVLYVRALDILLQQRVLMVFV